MPSRANTEQFGEPFEHDSNFRGPMMKRSCTDVICLLIFFVFLIAFGFAGYYAYREGDLDKILVPRDSNGLQCGKDNEVVDSPYLLFFDLSKCADPLVPIQGCQTTQICVKECPKSSFVFDIATCSNSELPRIRQELRCIDTVNVNSINSCNSIKTLIDQDKCARWYMKSEPFFNLCLSDLLPSSYECSARMLNEQQQSRRFRRGAWKWPDFENINWKNLSFSLPSFKDLKCERVDPAKRRMLKEKFEIAESYLGRFISNILRHFSDSKKVEGMGQMIVEDTVKVWPMLAVGLILSAFCSLIIIAVMRWIAGPIVWLSIFGVLGLLGTGTYFSYMKYMYYSDNPADRINLQPNLKSIINSYFLKADTWLYILIASSILLIVVLLFVIIFRKRIVIAIALIKEGSKAVSGNISTVFFPIFPWIIQAAVIVLSILMFVYLSSVGEPQHKVIGMKNSTTCACTGDYATIKDGDICDPKLFNQRCAVTSALCKASCMYTGLQAEPFVQYFKIINVFGFFWLVFFISAFGEMVLAGTFARWYWTYNKDDVPFFILTGSIYRTIRFHLGTLAFGSFIITLCRIIRLLLEYVDRKVKKVDNECTRAVMCCCKCFFWLLETFLKFLNKNAYIMCAIHGKNFLSSSKDAFNLLMRNVLRVIAVDKTTDILFFLSKMLISFGMAACTFTYITSDIFSQHFPDVLLHQPMAQVVFVFLGSYFIATIFFGVYSMAVDTLFLCFLEDSERNASPDRPYFMSDSLRKILGKKQDKFDG